jgi:hypothetical protein
MITTMMVGQSGRVVDIIAGGEKDEYLSKSSHLPSLDSVRDHLLERYSLSSAATTVASARRRRSYSCLGSPSRRLYRDSQLLSVQRLSILSLLLRKLS